MGARKPVRKLLEDGDFDPGLQVRAQREIDAVPQQAVVPHNEGSAVLEADFIEQLEDLSGGNRTCLREMHNRLEHDVELAG